MNLPERSSDAVDALLRLSVRGSTQWALVRGERRSSPVLLVLQAGPGFPMIHEARDFERALRLEEHFRVVYWDQRGTGKSYAAGTTDPNPLELGDLVADVRAVLGELCERLEVRQVALLGFSLGGSLALLAADAEPVRAGAVVCVGPDVDFVASERFAYEFALAEAQKRAHRRALRALRAIGGPPHAEARRFMTRVKWVTNFGGIHRGRTFGAMLRTTLLRLWTSPHYSLWDRIAALLGMTAMQRRLLPKLAGLDLLARRLRPRAPVAIFQGRHDVAAPPALGAALAEQLGARLVWFEDSAHAPHEEEPARFREALLEFLRLRPI